MGRLSAYAKNRILKLRFKKNKRIIHIVEILKRDDNIKVSRQAVSTFLKKYLETNSIYDKPRTGRKRKLTQEEIQLIGQVTRLNRDITARAIKEYLNLNVSTYTILRATKLFEWNKVNPNSNDSKKAVRNGKKSGGKAAKNSAVGGEDGDEEEEEEDDDDDEMEDDEDDEEDEDDDEASSNGEDEAEAGPLLTTCESVEMNNSTSGQAETVTAYLDANGDISVDHKPVVVHKKKALSKKQRRGNEKKSTNSAEKKKAAKKSSKRKRASTNSELDASNENDENGEVEKIQLKPLVDQELKKNISLGGGGIGGAKSHHAPVKPRHSVNSIPDFEKVDLNLMPHNELIVLKNLSCSPMSFATKILFKIFKIDELHGHNVSGKTLNKNLKAKLPLDPLRVGYIKFLVEKYYDEKECKEMLCGATSNKQDLWKSCHTAINKSILISERKAAAAEAAGKTFVYGDTSLLNFSETSAANRDALKGSTAGGNHDDDDDTNSELNSSMELLTAAARLKSKQTNNKRLKRKQSARRSKVKYSEGSEDSDGSDEADDFMNMSADEQHQQQQRRHNHDDGDDEFDDEEDTDTDPEVAAAPTKLTKAAILKRNAAKKSASKPKSKKLRLNNDATTDEDDDDDEDELEEEEIELIQNNRGGGGRQLTGGKSSDGQTGKEKDSANSKQPTVAESSEASAAANIAASMKKRYVVVAAPTDQPESRGEMGQVIATKSANKSTRLINRKISPPPKSSSTNLTTTTSSGRSISLSVPSASSSSIRQLPNRLKQAKETANKPLVEVEIKQEPSSCETAAVGGEVGAAEVDGDGEQQMPTVVADATTTTTAASAAPTTTTSGTNSSETDKSLPRYAVMGKSLRSRHQTTQPSEVSTSRATAVQGEERGGTTTIVTRSRSTRRV